MNRPIRSLSVIVPVYNEERILFEQISAMAASFGEFALPFEILIVENGSRDGTPGIITQLERKIPQVRAIRLPRSDYGCALREGVLLAKHDVAIIFNAEFWSAEFVRIALPALASKTLVIGSKSVAGAHDERPWIRRLITATYNRMLRIAWGFDGTDTHGMKAFWREDLVPHVSACVTGGFVFDTELVLRTQRADLRRMELPTDVSEIRPPSYESLLKRVPGVLRNLSLLARSVPPAPFGFRRKP